MTSHRRVAAAVALLVLVLPSAFGGHVAEPDLACHAVGCLAWMRGLGVEEDDTLASLALSPDGARLYAAGWVTLANGSTAARAVALDATTGDTLWAAGVEDAVLALHRANAIATSPGGGVVYLAGAGRDHAAASGAPTDFVLAALDAATGGTLWATAYDGPFRGRDAARAVAADGERVYVTGESERSFFSIVQYDYATVAFHLNGTRAWTSRYQGFQHDLPRALALGGGRVYVTGQSHSGSGGVNADYVTVAYDAGTGSQRWSRSYNAGGSRHDVPRAIGLTPDGTGVVVTGESARASTGVDWVTARYAADTGNVFWEVSLDSGESRADRASHLVHTPDGKSLLVAGASEVAATGQDAVVVAYDATPGFSRWTRRLAGPGLAAEEPRALLVTPDGLRALVLVAATAEDGSRSARVVALDVEDGAVAWQAPIATPLPPVDVAGAAFTRGGTALAAVATGAPDGNASLPRDAAAASVRLLVEPEAPASVAVVPGPRGGEATLSWEPPRETGGRAVFEYRLYRAREDAPLTLHATFASTTLTVKDTRLQHGTVYRYAVSAVTHIGEGPRAGPVEVLTFTFPGPTRNLTWEPGPEPREVTLAWEPPERDGGAAIRAFLVFRSADGEEWDLVGATRPDAPRFKQGGLTPLVPVYYRVGALSIVGLGPTTDPVCTVPSPWVKTDAVACPRVDPPDVPNVVRMPEIPPPPPG